MDILGRESLDRIAETGALTAPSLVGTSAILCYGYNKYQRMLTLPAGILGGFELAKIVIIEDSGIMRSSISSSLRKTGHEIIEVDPTGLFDVLKKLKEVTPDVIITDILMPSCPGYGLIRACREEELLKNTAIIVVTALRDLDLENSIKKFNLIRYLHKPFELNALREEVSKILMNNLDPDTLPSV